MYSGGSLYRSLFTAHPLATWIVAGDTLRILDANAAAVAFANRPLDELIGRFAPDLALPDDADAFAAQLRDPAATPNRVGRFPGLDGNERLVSVHVQPFAVDGKTLLTVVLQDVTARVRSAIRRRQNEERQALIARTVSDASWDWNLTTDALWWDESVERLFGYPRAEIGPDIHWWAERIHPEDRERIERSLAEAFATGADQWEGEYRFRRADGRYTDVRDRGAIVRDAAGKPVRMVGAMVDISEYRRVARAFEQSEARFRAIFEQAAIGVAEIDLRGRIVRANASFDRLVGSRLIGNERPPVLSIVAEDERPRAARALRQMRREGLSYLRGELRCRRQDGTTFWAEATATVVRDDVGAPQFGILLLEDISSRKEAERRAQDVAQAEKLHSLGQMASGVAHNVNQSLGLIGGHSQLALAELNQLSPNLAKLRESMVLIRQAVDDCTAIVKRLQTFARPGAEGSPQAIELRSLLEDVALLTAPRWRDLPQQEGRPIQLVVRAEPGLLVRGWPEALHEALFNLVFNAVDALPRGGEIVCAARREGAEAVIEVADTGVGMPESVLGQIFEPFFTTKGESGTGIGLPTVFRIVERHLGTIAVRSKPGAGTTFTIRLPALEECEPSDGEPRPAERGPARRVLVVDDDARIADMARRMLELDRHHVAVASSAEEALARLTVEPFDVVLSDLGLGAGMNGWEFAEAVRHRWPDIRFILATGWGAELDAAVGRARGVSAIVSKPYTVADLRRQLAR